MLQFKPFLIFIGTFFAAYIVLTVLYKLYLGSFGTDEMDGITKLVCTNVEQLMQLFSSDSKITESIIKASYDISYNNKYVARIVEGCNAISVIILFVSFVLAFSGKLKQTFLFILTGIILIYIFNITRIALLAALLYHYPESRHFLHNVLFPLIIYGVVFILWVIWVKKFSKYAD